MSKSVKSLQDAEPFVSGAGSKVDAKKPVYRNASGYRLEEDVNSGLTGGGSPGKPFHGQDSDNWAAEKNKLVGQPEYQRDPYRAKGQDWPVNRVHARTEQDGIGDYGYSEGKNDLVRQGLGLEGPRHNEDGGQMMPVPGDRSRVIASAFPIEISKGESSSNTGKEGIKVMVDLQTGHIRGGETGMTDYIPDINVRMPGPIPVSMKAGHTGQQR